MPGHGPEPAWRMEIPMRRICARGGKNPTLAAGILKRLWREDEGQDLVEYGLLLLLVGLVCVTSMNTVAGAILNVFNNAASNLTSAVS